VLFLASLIVHLLLLVGSPILLGLTAKVKRLIPEDPVHFSQGTVVEVLVVVVAVVIVFVVVVVVVVVVVMVVVVLGVLVVPSITCTIFPLQHSHVSTGYLPTVQANPSGTILPSKIQQLQPENFCRVTQAACTHPGDFSHV